MIDPSIGKALADLGGFALFMLVISIAAIGLHRQWWVPGWIYTQVKGENAELRKTVVRLTGELQRERRRRRDDTDA